MDFFKDHGDDVYSGSMSDVCAHVERMTNFHEEANSKLGKQ